MISAQDLRLGNWIKLNDETGSEVKVTAITETTVSFKSKSILGQMEISKFAGIPITEEWLERLGFKKSQYVWEIEAGNYQLEYSLHSKELFIMTSGDMYGIHVKAKYIHELQNVTHSLTGE